MIQIDQLKKAFGTKIVLDGLNLEVPQSKIAFLLGKSGVGKSVLLKNLVGLLRADSGQIWIDGKEISRYSENQFEEVRRNCGLIFQSPALFDSLTVFENVAFGLRCDRRKWKEEELAEKVRKTLREVGLKESLEARMPSGLSFGTQKRVSIARTLAIGPKYLLFDEPTTGLDPIATAAVNEVILNLSRKLGVTSLIVSHDIQSALSIGDRLFFIDEGKIVAEGNSDQMKQSEVPLVKSFLSEFLGE